MRSLRLLAALALAAAATLTATTADAAPGDGTITVTMVDEHGDPMPGMIYVAGASGGFTNTAQAHSTATFTVPAGAYGAFGFTPWGGMQCVGLETCDYYALAGGAAVPDGDITVTAGSDTTITITGAVPASLHGPAQVGLPLALDFSDGMQMVVDYLGGAGFAPTVTWLRDGVPIAGATDDRYTPVGADAGREISARLEYVGTALAQFQLISGAPVTPRTTNSLKINKVPTKAFAILSNPVVKAGNHGKVRVEVTAKNLIVTGKAVVTVGDWSQTRALRNGTARVILPKLAPGKHVVEMRYLGTSVYDGSRAQPRTLTVTN